MIVINYIETKDKTYTRIAGLINEEFDIIEDSLLLNTLIKEYRDRFYTSILYELYVVRDSLTKDFQLVAFLEKAPKENQEFTYNAEPLPKTPKEKSKYVGEYGRRLAELKKNNLWNPTKPKKQDN